MSEKRKTFVPPALKTVRNARPSAISAASTCRKVPPLNKKDKEEPSCSKNLNSTRVGNLDTTIMKSNKTTMPNFEAEYRQIAYGRFLRSMLEDCLLDEKIEREETQMDIQMTQLADRFSKTADHLDKTCRRLKEISFIQEQKRLLELKNMDSSQFYTMTQNSGATELLQNIHEEEQARLDKLLAKNVDFGFDNTSGHKQLLEAVKDAIDGLDEIKKRSNLDSEKFKEYEHTEKNLQDLQTERFDFEALKSEFEVKFPIFSEKFLKDASGDLAKMLEDDDDDADEN